MRTYYLPMKLFKSSEKSSLNDRVVHWERKIMRLCAVGMVTDGSLDYHEKSAIKEIIIRDWGSENKVSAEEIDFTFKPSSNSDELKAIDYIEHLYERLRNDTDAQQGLFVDIKSLSDFEALEELRDIVYVIKADSVVAEVERIAFVAIAKIFKFTNIDGIWDLFYGKKKKELKDLSVRYDMYSGRRSQINVYDVGVIEKAIIQYGIDGPLRLGLQSAIQRDKYDLLKYREKRHKLISRIALVVFAFSSIILYFECAHLLEYKIIANEHNIHMPQPVIDLLCADGDSLLRSNSIWCEKYSNLLEPPLSESEEIELRHFQIEEGMRYSMLDGVTKALLLFFLCLILYIATLIFRRVRKRFKFKYNKSISKNVLLLLGGIFMICFYCLYRYTPKLNILISYTPLWVLCMMLSIEIMIFMREKYTAKINTEKKESSTLLIIFVVAAVTADLCIGFIELPPNVDPVIIVNKIAYSIFLGCVSFFAGKFMEMDSIQKQVDVEKMEKSMSNINDYIANLKKS